MNSLRLAEEERLRDRQVWAFGMFGRAASSVRLFALEDRTQETLLPLPREIRKIQPGFTLIVGQIGYDHGPLTIARTIGSETSNHVKSFFSQIIYDL